MTSGRGQCLADANFTGTWLCSARKPLRKGTMTPTSWEKQQMLQKHSKELFDNPVEEQTAVFSVQQELVLQAHLHSAAQAGWSWATLGCAGLSFLSVSLLHRLFHPTILGDVGKRSHFSPELTSERLLSGNRCGAHPWRTHQVPGAVRPTRVPTYRGNGSRKLYQRKKGLPQWPLCVLMTSGPSGLWNIHPECREGKGTPHSQSLLFLLPSSLSFPSPVSQLLNCRLPCILKWSLNF